MRRIVAVVPLVLLAGVLVAWALEEVRVVEREARVRADKRKFGESLRTLREGDTVALVKADPPWVRVKAGPVEGWLHESAVTRDKRYVFSRASLGANVEASERTAGQKGFDPATEAAYRASKPELDAAFRLVDRLDATPPDDARLARFIADGKLAGGAR
jgi:hypothetical protein